MKKLLYVLMLMLTFSSYILATNYIQVNDNTYVDTDSVEYYINKQGKKDYNKITLWTKSINNNSPGWKKIEEQIKKSGEKRKPTYEKTKLIINCKQKIISVASIHYYDDNGNSLDSLNLLQNNLNTWSDIVPNSIGEYYYDNVCTATKKKRWILNFLLGSSD